MADPPVTITEAASALKKQFPKIQIISAAGSFLTVTYQRTLTSHVKVKSTLTCPKGYDATATLLVVTVDGGNNVPPGLKRKLENQMGEAAKGKEEEHTFFQLQAALQSLANFLDTNLFVPCWKELRQVVELIQGNNNSAGDTIRMNETTGQLRFTLNTGNYHIKFSVTVDPEYPNTANITSYGQPCRLKVESGTFPDPVKTTLSSQAAELVRRMQDGMSVEQALIMSNPVHLPSTSGNTTGETPDQAWQRQDQERRKHYGFPLDQVYDGSQPQPSLLSLVKFLHRSVHALPKVKCPFCHEQCLSANPQSKLSKSKQLTRVYCGHWYHWGCLHQLMNQPPFGIQASCQECGKELYHPDWPKETAAKREREYQQRQAKEREIADAADFF